MEFNKDYSIDFMPKKRFILPFDLDLFSKGNKKKIDKKKVKSKRRMVKQSKKHR